MKEVKEATATTTTTDCHSEDVEEEGNSETENIKAITDTEDRVSEHQESKEEEVSDKDSEETSEREDAGDLYEWFCVFCRKITDWKPNLKIDTAVCTNCETEGTNYKEDCQSC